jgi:peptide/nickel transport system ATP-binding protein
MLTTNRPEQQGTDAAESLLRIDQLSVDIPIATKLGTKAKAYVHAVDDVSLELRRGETLAIVGESGAGKTTLGRTVLRRINATSGKIWFKNRDITAVRGEELRALRREMQLIFQDPYASLNPRMRVAQIVAEPLVVHGMVKDAVEARSRVIELLELVGLPPDAIDRHPHAFSGGQRQRIGIARAIALHPDLIVADEPVSALDVSIRVQVINLLLDLQSRFGLSYLFISHDLSVVKQIAHRIAIMYAGQIVEIGDTLSICDDPQHPYTKALLSAVPIPDPVIERERHRTPIAGEMPDPTNPPKGCRFHTRCPIAVEHCSEEAPPLELKRSGNEVACWLL